MQYLVALLTLCIFLPLQAAEQPLPTEDVAQRALNLALRAQRFQLEGAIRVGKVRHPVRIVTDDWVATYQFTDSTFRVLTLLGPDRKVVEVGEHGDPARVLSGKDLRGHVLGTDVTYEDLALVFTLYPPVAGSIHTDTIDALPAWRFDVVAPAFSSYATVRIWMSSRFYGLLRVDALNAQGQTVKRLSITNITKAGSTYILKEMMISSMIPGRELATSNTYVDIDSYHALP